MEKWVKPAAASCILFIVGLILLTNDFSLLLVSVSWSLCLTFLLVSISIALNTDKIIEQERMKEEDKKLITLGNKSTSCYLDFLEMYETSPKNVPVSWNIVKEKLLEMGHESVFIRNAYLTMFSQGRIVRKGKNVIFLIDVNDLEELLK